MTDEELQQIRERVNETREIVAHQPLIWDDLWTHAAHDVLYQNAPALLAEVERLRAENAAMREIVQAVATLEDTTFPGDWSGYDYHDVNEIVTKARAILGL